MPTLPSEDQQRGLSWLPAALIALVVCGYALLLVSTASAADFTWSGGGGSGSTLWSNNANWLGNIAPTSGATIGTLTFPERSNSHNDLTGVSVEHLAVDNSVGFGLSGNGLTLGSGGLSFTASQHPPIFSTNITAPFSLSGNQAWSVSAPSSSGINPPQDFISFQGQLTGASSNLTINLNTLSQLAFGSFFGSTGPDDEIGNVTVNGSDTVVSTTNSEGEPIEVVYKSGLALPVGLNGSDGKSLTVNDIELSGSGPTGPITAIKSRVGLSGPAIGALTSVGSLVNLNGNVASLSLDEQSASTFNIDSVGTTPGADYEQMTSAGSIGLGGTLELGSYQDEEKKCPPPPVGHVYTLISTTGSFVGTYSNVPNGSTVVAECVASAEGAPTVERVYSYRIDYNTGGSTKTVTATALPAVPVSYSEEPPTVSGTATQGQTLSESHAFWSNNPSGYSDQWQRCDGSGSNCQDIAGATAQTYTLTAADVDSTIRMQETASNGEGNSIPALSAPTAVVQAAPSGGGGSTGGVGFPPLSCCDGGPRPLGPPPVNISAAQITALLQQQLTLSGKTAKIGTLLKNGGITMPVTALEAGTLVVRWYEVPAGAKLAKKAKIKPTLVASGQMTFSTAGNGKLKIKLTAAGKRLLKHAKRVKLTAKGTFVPTGGATVGTAMGFVLR